MQVGGAAVSLGAKASASSIPVVLATDEAAVTVVQPTASSLNAIVQQGVPTVGGLSQSWPIKISDAVNGPAAVKNASTAAAAADPSLVVALSPNSPLPAGTNALGSTIGTTTGYSTANISNATSTGMLFQINTVGYETVVIAIHTDSGTFSTGQIQFNGQINGALITSLNVVGMREKSGLEQSYDAKSTHNLAANEDWNYVIPCAGMQNITVLLQVAITGTGTAIVTGRAAANSAPGPTTVGQSDATKLNATTIGTVNSVVSATWTSATVAGTALTVPCAGAGSVYLYIQGNANVTGGQLRFLEGFINTDVLGMRFKNLTNPCQNYDATNYHTFAANDTWLYVFNVAGMSSLVVYLNSAITGASSSVVLNARAVVGTPPGPTTVGQSDPTKLNATITPVHTAASSTLVVPGAGADINTTWGVTGVLQTFRARLTTSAQAGNRLVTFIFSDTTGSNSLYAPQMSFTIPANQIVDFYFGLAFPFNTAISTNGQVFLPLPLMTVMSNWIIKTQTSALQTSDQWSQTAASFQTA